MPAPSVPGTKGKRHRKRAVDRLQVAARDAAGDEANQHLVGARVVELEAFDLERRGMGADDGCSDFHGRLSGVGPASLQARAPPQKAGLQKKDVA